MYHMIYGYAVRRHTVIGHVGVGTYAGHGFRIMGLWNFITILKCVIIESRFC